ncbi:MAG: response regulator [Chthoniobacterales bacterium]|nr:response regulator [Chthoniobacterales bacterium]
MPLINYVMGDSTAREDRAASGAEYFDILGRATSDAVRDWRVKEGKLIWPHGLENLLGYSDFTEATEIGFWTERLHPEDRGRIQESIHRALSGPDEHWLGEYRFRRADGEYRNIYERALLLRCPDPRVVSVMMDVTEREELQSQVCRWQRMEAFGQLAGGVAHDFNNFLTTILGYSDLLLSENLVRGQIANHIGEIHDAAERASALTNQLLAFSRRQAMEPTVLEINALVTSLEKSLLRLLGEHITIDYQLHQLKEGAYIKADTTQLNQLLLNLAMNAREAMSEGGCLTITTAAVRLEADDPPLGPGADFAHGEFVTIDVADTGSGMTEEVKARVFEPFFTTKAKTERNGLGLATSYGIVRQSGGHISVESAPGQGTRFRIYLPRVNAPERKRRGFEKLRSGSETILVLEDDLSVRHLSVRLLRRLGYDVLEAAHSDDAQRLLAENGSRKIDLLLTDMVLPKMSGRTFAAWLRNVSPLTKVIFVSGYLEESLPAEDRCAPGTRFLPKPFTAEQLAQQVRAVLDGEA